MPVAGTKEHEFMNEEKYQERLKLIEDAVAFRPTSRVPVCPFISSVAQRLNGSSYRDLYYDHDRAGEALLKFYDKYQPDAYMFSGFISGKSNEIAESNMIDWPGRPGTSVSDYSSHQVIEHEYMLADEYPELLSDFTGFMLRKYIPRAFPGLAGLSGVHFRFATILNTGLFGRAYAEPALAAYEKLAEIGRLDREAQAKSAYYQSKLAEMGFPPFMTGAAEAPYDILGDYFRGTMGMFEDLIEREEDVERACWMFADHQIENLAYLKAPMPVKRVFFPLHKGMDGFINPDQYERLYLRPLMKVVDYLISVGATPILYTEGKYDTRLEILRDYLPKGKCIVHIESSDIVRAKQTVGTKACLTGNLPIYLLEFGKKQEVIDYCKFLIDTCAPGGGYIFDTDGSIENAKEENLEAMFDTVFTYGKY